MKKIQILFASIISIFTPVLVSAHVKWFVDTENTIAELHGKVPFYSWNSTAVLVWCGVVALVVFVFSRVDRVVKAPSKLIEFGERNRKNINRVAEVILGIFLVTVSFVWGIILVPDIKVVGNIDTVLMILQALIGIMYIFGIRPRTASIGLLIFCAGLGLHNGPVTLLENAILISLALYFFIVHAPAESSVSIKWGKRALDIVRIGTAISLITLAFTEKLLYPELSMQFLSVHHWNFMQYIFPWYSDKLFVLSTGFAELIFGFLFLFGYITRVTTIFIAIFFATSVTTMLIQTGAWEVEDLVVYSAAVLFIFLSPATSAHAKRVEIAEK